MRVLMTLLLLGLPCRDRVGDHGDSSVRCQLTDGHGRLLLARPLALARAGLSGDICGRFLWHLPPLPSRLEARLRIVVSVCGRVYFSGLVDALAPAVWLGRCDSCVVVYSFCRALLGELVAQAKKLVL